MGACLTVFLATVVEPVALQGFVFRNMDATVGATNHIGTNPWAGWLLAFRFCKHPLDHAVKQPEDQSDNDKSDKVHACLLLWADGEPL